MIEFARDVLAHPLDPWQQFVVIHGGELLPDGRPRFRHVIILVARQNGKTEIPVVLSLYWQWACQIPLVLGTSTKLDYARESWLKAVKLAERAPEIPVTRNDRRKWTRQTNGEQESWNTTADGEDCRYKIAASNEEGGRSLTVHRLILDELRQHKTYAAWSASVPAGNAVRDFQVWALSNAGDHTSVVLADKRAAALDFIETGEGDYRLGLFEYSSPDGSNPEDLEALAYANPNLGAPHDHGLDPEALLGEARTAVAAGGEALAIFRIENMCQWVALAFTAIDLTAWAAGRDPASMDGLRDRLACVFDMSPDGLHATLGVAALVPSSPSAPQGDRYRVEVVRAWDGPDAVAQARRELPGLVARIKPRVFGWYPGGPAAAVAAELRERKPAGWPPRGVQIEEIRADTPAVCMGFAELVIAGQVVHSGDPLLDAHVEAAEKLSTGDRWVFARRRGGHVDAVYAVAGAVHLARIMKLPRAPMLVVARG